MKKITFNVQLFIGLVCHLTLFALAHWFKLPLLINSAWISYGLLWILNPVLPPNWEAYPEKRWILQLAGGISIAVGILVRFGV